VVAGMQEAVGAWNRRPLCQRGRRQDRGKCRPRVVFELQVSCRC
jgi:hypothetical protein